jgi:hypothetical protein
MRRLRGKLCSSSPVRLGFSQLCKTNEKLILTYFDDVTLMRVQKEEKEYTVDDKSKEKKSTQLDDLSREEQIRKCKNLLVIAKKAKASKDGK